MLLDALASDCGAGWVSPEQHAEVVRERDEARAFAESWRLSYMTVADAIAPRSENAAQLAKAVRDVRDDARRHYENATALAKECGDLRGQLEQLESYRRGLKQRRLIEGLPLPPRLAERVKLLEAVAREARAYKNGEVSGTFKMADALATLDAHDNQGGAA